jgi:hypothetical protein
MDSLKLIPSVFFDGIARVVPGATAIVAYLLLSGSTWSQILEKTLGRSFAESDALLTATGLLFFAAYVVGQLIAPLAKGVQRIGEGKKIKWNKIQKMFDPPKMDDDAYDVLRFYHKDAGAQCAKIRAEFTMYNGLAIVFLASSIGYGVLTPTWNWLVMGTLVGAALATAIRGRTTRDTFNETVMKFTRAAKLTKLPAEQPTGPAIPPSGLARADELTE